MNVSRQTASIQLHPLPHALVCTQQLVCRQQWVRMDPGAERAPIPAVGAGPEANDGTGTFCLLLWAVTCIGLIFYVLGQSHKNYITERKNPKLHVSNVESHPIPHFPLLPTHLVSFPFCSSIPELKEHSSLLPGEDKWGCPQQPTAFSLLQRQQ